MAHVSMATPTTDARIEAVRHRGEGNPAYAVALYVGSAYCTLYLSVEEARALALRLLDITATNGQVSGQLEIPFPV